MKTKRSRKLNLDAMRKTGLTTAVASSILLGGCSDSTPASAFRSIDECVKARPGCTTQCQSSYDKAHQQALVNAPHYRTRADCEYDFGSAACTSDNRLGYAPRMQGFLMPGTGRCDSSTGVHASGSGGRALYTSINRTSPAYDRWVTNDGQDLGSARQSQLDAPASAFDSAGHTSRTLSRGGFGETVRARSFSSSKSSFGG